MRKKVTAVTKRALEASRRYPEKYVWYFRMGNNECYVIGGNSGDAFKRSRIAPDRKGVVSWCYLNGRIS